MIAACPAARAARLVPRGGRAVGARGDPGAEVVARSRGGRVGLLARVRGDGPVAVEPGGDRAVGDGDHAAGGLGISGQVGAVGRGARDGAGGEDRLSEPETAEQVGTHDRSGLGRAPTRRLGLDSHLRSASQVDLLGSLSRFRAALTVVLDRSRGARGGAWRGSDCAPASVHQLSPASNPNHTGWFCGVSAGFSPLQEWRYQL